MLSDYYLNQISYLIYRNHNCGVLGAIQSGKDQYYSTGRKEHPSHESDRHKDFRERKGHKSLTDQNDRRIKRQQKLNRYGDNHQGLEGMMFK